MLLYRLKAYEHFKTLKEPSWQYVKYDKIDYQNIHYYSAPKKNSLTSLDQIDKKILDTYEKLGIPLNEQKKLANVAVDAVFDSVSVATTYKEKLIKQGIIFCSMSFIVTMFRFIRNISSTKNSSFVTIVIFVKGR